VRCPIIKSCGIDLGEREFAAEATPTKAVGDRCCSARINQSILALFRSHFVPPLIGGRKIM